MRPRYYSICSSPLLHTDCIHIALSLEYFTCQMDSPTPIGGKIPTHTLSHVPTSTSSVKPPPPPPPVYYRKGLCTNYIYELCRSEFGLDRSLLTHPAHPSTRFKLPSSSSNTTLLLEEGVYGATSSTDEVSVVQAVAEVSLSTTGITTDATTTSTTTTAVSTAMAAVTEGVSHINTPSFTPSGARPHLRIFLKPSLTFRLPGSVGPPLILIGRFIH